MTERYGKEEVIYSTSNSISAQIVPQMIELRVIFHSHVPSSNLQLRLEVIKFKKLIM